LQFAVHAIDKKGILATRAKFYRQHRIHLDEAGNHGIGVVTAGRVIPMSPGAQKMSFPVI
jgi:hypothetical protein